MDRISRAGFAVVVLVLCAQISIPSRAQQIPDLSGMWSDPPPRAEDAFCHVGCPLEAREYLTRLLDDPANLDLSYAEIRAQAQAYQMTEIIPRHLTPEALEHFPLDRRLAPLSAACDPWGFARQILAPHAFEISQYDDRVTLYYSEWTARRTVYLDGREPPADLEPGLLGYSVGHYEDATLVVETTGISANFSNSGFTHSDQLAVTERYTRSGDRLEVEATLEDPQTFREPLVMTRAWVWSPAEEIYPYEDCVIPGN